MKPLLATFLILCMTGLPSCAQRTDDQDLLLFGQAWLDPTDYAWSRESFSRLESDTEPGARVKDFGRVRVRFSTLEEDLLGLDIRVLSYRYEAELRGKKPMGGKSELEGTRLPDVWLHSVLGFSVGTDPSSGIQSNIQTGEIFDLIDFRGFVPREVPVRGEEWTARMVRKPDDRYRFREDRERRFACVEIEKMDQGERFKISFNETLKVTSMESSRSHEIREAEGSFWVFLPEGLIDAVSWEAVATEYSAAPRGEAMDKVETRTVVNLVRRDPPPPKPRGKQKQEETTHDEPPLPPR